MAKLVRFNEIANVSALKAQKHVNEYFTLQVVEGIFKSLQNELLNIFEDGTFRLKSGIFGLEATIVRGIVVKQFFFLDFRVDIRMIKLFNNKSTHPKAPQALYKKLCLHCFEPIKKPREVSWSTYIERMKFCSNEHRLRHTFYRYDTKVAQIIKRENVLIEKLVSVVKTIYHRDRAYSWARKGIKSNDPAIMFSKILKTLGHTVSFQDILEK